MKLFLGSDHAGFEVKERLKTYFKQNHFNYEDMGCDSQKSADYPDIAKKVALEVIKSDGNKGVLICGTGIGMSMAANAIKGAHAALVYNESTAKMSSEHNNANILCLGGREFPYERLENFVKIWLETPFSQEPRHQNRINKIMKLEE
jgi:ribose 5-phosphate isomerase B